MFIIMTYFSIFFNLGFISRSIYGDYTVTLREEYAQRLVSLECPLAEISVIGISSQKGTCGTNYCKSELMDKIKKQCDSNSNCSLDSKLLDYCGRLPIYLNVYFECRKYRFGRWYRWYRKAICSDKLNSIRCYHKKAFNIYYPSIYSTSWPEKDCITGRLINLCQGRRICGEETNHGSCLFEKKYVNISYTCKDKPYKSTATHILTFTQSTTKHDEPHRDKPYTSRGTNNLTFTQTTTKHDEPDIGTTAAIAGTSIAVIIAVIVAIVTVLFLRKRTSNIGTEKQHTPLAVNTTQRHENTDAQIAGMPIAHQRAPDSFVYSVANGSCRGVSAMEESGDGYFVLEKENRSTNVVSDRREDEYATSSNVAYNKSGENFYSHSKEGVYDQTANTKQKPNEEAVYSHSVDGLYDTAVAINDNSDNLYSHSVEGIYDKASDVKQKSNIDNLYSQSVDDFYDRLRQNMTPHDAEDTYNHVFGAVTEDDYSLTQ